MIIFKIPRKVGDRDLREYILNQIKKMRRNIKHKYIQLKGDIAYSRDYVYFIFPSRALELAFALSLSIKCQQHNLPCELEISKPIELDKLPKEVLEAAEIWARRKLQRRFYRLKNQQLQL